MIWILGTTGSAPALCAAQVTHPAGEEIEEEQQSLLPALASLCSNESSSTLQLSYAARCVGMLASQDKSSAARGLVDETVVSPLSSILGRGEAAAEVSLYDPVQTAWPSEKIAQRGGEGEEGGKEEESKQEAKEEQEDEEQGAPVVPGSFTPRSEAATALRALKALSATVSAKAYVESEDWPEDLDKEQPEVELADGVEEGEDSEPKTPPFVLPAGFVTVDEAFFSVTKAVFGALTSSSPCRSADLEDSVRIALFEIVAEMAAVNGGLGKILDQFRPPAVTEGEGDDEQEAKAAGDEDEEGGAPSGPVFVSQAAYDASHFHYVLLGDLVSTIKGADDATNAQRLVAIKALTALLSVKSPTAAVQSLNADLLAQNAIFSGVLGHLIAIKLNTSLGAPSQQEAGEGVGEGKREEATSAVPQNTLVKELKSAAFHLFKFLASRGEVREEHFREQQRKADEEAAAAAA